MSTSRNQEHIALSCKWCSQILGTGYYFTCKKCLSTYCYIHKDMHKCKINIDLPKQKKSRKKVI